MNLTQLKALVKKGESETLEFTRSTGSLNSAMHTVCAFLNSARGGKVLFGVTDDGKITGRVINDKTLKEVAMELGRLEPYTQIRASQIKVAHDRHVLVFDVEPDHRAPYTYDGRAYVRQQSTTTLMPKDEYIALHYHNNPSQWEVLTNKRTLMDLDYNRIREVIRRAVQERRLPESAVGAKIPDILQKLGLYSDGKLTNAALVLFGKKEEAVPLQCNVRLARFAGTDKRVFLDMKDFRANAFDLFDRAMQFLHFNLPVAAYIDPKTPVRVEVPAIPYVVLREAITNALIHRDYSNSGSSIFVAVYDDRVNITNIGALPRGVTLKQLSKTHDSVQRNPLIAHVFYLCGQVEKWGRGTLDMIQECKKADVPEPIYDEVGGSFSIIFPLKEPLRGYEAKKKPAVPLTIRQEKILHVLEYGPLSTQELIKLVKINLSERAVRLELSKLEKMNLIRSTGSTKKRFWQFGNNSEIIRKYPHVFAYVHHRLSYLQRGLNRNASQRYWAHVLDNVQATGRTGRSF